MVVGYSGDVVRKNNIKKKRKQKRILGEEDKEGTGDTHRNTHRVMHTKREQYCQRKTDRKMSKE